MTVPNAGEDADKVDHPCIANGNVKMAQPSCKTIWQFLIKLNTKKKHPQTKYITVQQLYSTQEVVFLDIDAREMKLSHHKKPECDYL